MVNAQQLPVDDSSNFVISDKDIYKDEDWLSFQYHLKGLSQSEIGDVCDVSQTTVKHWMDKYDIQSRGPGGVKEPPFDMQECISLYKNGLGSRKVAKKLNTSRSTVREWLDYHDIERHPSGMKKVDETDKREIVELYDRGFTQQEVSEKVRKDINQTTVSRVLRESSVDIRNKAGFGQVCYSNNGLEVKSKLEKLTANWLEENVDDFIYEPDIDGTDYIPDFLVEDTIVEVWGITSSDSYDERRQSKMEEYNDMGYSVVSVEPEYSNVEESLSESFSDKGKT